MASTGPATPSEDQFPPEVEIAKRKGLSIVWLIPLVAAVVAGWLVYTTFAEKGPTVSISFKAATGLEAEKTKVKLKDLDVGTVTSLTIAPDLSHVIVTAELHKELEHHLGPETRFWVVRPMLTASGVSGLSTLISGSFIEIDPVAGPIEDEFVGLETPPLVRSDDPGREFVLTAETLGSVGRGSPISFRGITVGEVMGYALAEDNDNVEINIFVKDPYSDLIRPGTRFWNASGISATLDAQGVRVSMESVTSLLVGGVAFETSPAAMIEEPSPAGAVFTLFPSRETEQEERFTQAIPFMARFDGSVRGLEVGAPVEYRGIRVGTVKDLRLISDMDVGRPPMIVVIFDLEPERIHGIGQSAGSEDAYGSMAELVDKGLRAQLEQGSLITGSLYLSLDFHEDVEPAKLGRDGVYPEMPTLPTDLERIARSVNDVLNTISDLPLAELVNDLRGTIQSVDALVTSPEVENAVANLEKSLEEVSQLVAKVDRDITPLMASFKDASEAAEAALQQAESTMKSADSILRQDSVARHNLTIMLKELAEAARSIRMLTDYLEQHPEALIQGKGG
nr:MCE family protein [Desulfuromonadales bacterium]